MGYRDDNGGGFAPGDPITWLLTITNEGNREARDVEVVDPIDPNLSRLNAVGGEVVDGTASSTLAVIDTDPDSARYLEILTWIVNR